MADGAIFALVDSTDPEMLVIIEARETAKGLSWMYAPVRQNHRRLQLSYKKKIVWDVSTIAPPWYDNPLVTSRESPYFNERWALIYPPEGQSGVQASGS